MENRKIVVNIQDVVTRLPELRFEEPLNWIIEEGQQWAVIGPNGAGKTLIADVMQRKFALKEGEVTFGYEGNVGNLVKSIAFKDIYSWPIAAILIISNVGIRLKRTKSRQ